MYRLIVIDDDADAVNSLSKNYPWEQSGFELVSSFQDGENALKWLETHQVELILCDIKMPRMNGIELARRLHVMKRKEKIVFISGYKDFEFARKALEYGVCNYCIKPVRFSEMERILGSIRESLSGETSIEKNEAKTDGEQQNLTDMRITRIHHYIDRYYASATLQTIAEYMQMSTSYLSSFYKEKTGKKLGDRLTEVRLEKALHLLKSGECHGLSELAERVGYTNAISFSRSFKRHFGVTPTDVMHDFHIITPK